MYKKSLFTKNTIKPKYKDFAMEKKGTIFSLIFVACVVIGVILTIILMGITAGDYNYVQIEINPRVEILCDKKFKVVSVSPLNEDASIVLSDINLVGMDINKATEIYLDECAKTGYLDVDGIDNAVNLTVVDGLTQALDVHIMQCIYKYLKNNEIMTSVTENYEVRTMFDKKKENNMCCVNKYKLVSTLEETQSVLDFDTLKKMSEVNLIDVVKSNHENNPYTPTEENIQAKQKLIESNKDKYTNHKNNITNNTLREFSELFDDFQKSSGKKYQQDFEKEYTKWQESHTN